MHSSTFYSRKPKIVRLFHYRVIKIGPQNAQLICLPPDEGHTERNHESGLKSALTLPKKDTQSAMVYHQKFHSYMKSNPMYRGTPAPWAMVNR
jgi:hypothetical protein